MTEELIMPNSRQKIDFSWKKNDPDHFYTGRQFSMRFPDEFAVTRDTRYEFYACMKDPDDPEKNLITVKPGRMTTLQTFGMSIHSQDLLLAILHLNALKGMGGLLWIADRSESFTVRVDSNELLCFYDRKDRTASFYVYMVFGNAVRPIIITMEGLDGPTGERERRMIRELVSHLKLNQQSFQRLPLLTDKAFTKGILILQTTDQWKHLLIEYTEELEHVFYVNLQITQQKIRVAQKKKNFSEELAESWYRQKLKQYASEMETLLESTVEFLKLVYEANRENPVFYELAADIVVFLQNNLTVSFSIDHEEKTETVRNAENVRAKWRYCILQQQAEQTSEKRDVLANMDRSLQQEYEEVQRQYGELNDNLRKLENQVEEKRKQSRLARQAELENIKGILRKKELELGECYAQQKALKQQMINLSFLHRKQKEEMSRQLSAVVIRTGKIHTEIDNLEDCEISIETREDEELKSLVDQMKSFRLRIRLKEEEVLKARKIVERNRKLLDEKEREVQNLQEELRIVMQIAEKTATDEM